MHGPDNIIKRDYVDNQLAYKMSESDKSALINKSFNKNNLIFNYP